MIVVVNALGRGGEDLVKIVGCEHDAHGPLQEVRSWVKHVFLGKPLIKTWAIF